MANNLSAFSPTLWSAIIQPKLYKKNVFRQISAFGEQKLLTYGQTVNRPYRSDIFVQNYVKGTALTAQDVSGTQESLTVNNSKGALVYVDKLDMIQNKYSMASYYTDELSTRLGNAIDAVVLGEAQNAVNTVDDLDINGGTTGNGFILTTANILNVFGKVNRKLDQQNAPKNRFMVVSPQFKDILWQYIGGRESMLGDKTATDASLGSFGGFDLYLSNNLYASARIAFGANPSNADTITIAGAGFSAITFTFVSSIGTTAGNVLIGGSATATAANLAALINAPDTTTANGVALSAANIAVLQSYGVTATASTTNVDVKVLGGSYLTLTSSNGSNVWTTALQQQHVLAGVYGATDVVIQAEPSIDSDKMVSAGKAGMNFLALTLFGQKTFNYGTKLLVDVKINSSVF